ncbi:MAG: hypothetical protein GWN62_24400, partial [Aliifodinibius sp.]|nr:hypothetical protein [Fodinibius sp.]
YGQAQSGVVNITSRSGKSKFESGLEYRTDRIFDNSYNTQFLSAYIGGPDPFTGKLLPQLGLGLPGKFSFFLSTNTNLSNTFYNNHRDRQDISFLGINFQERQDNSLNLNAKLDWDNEKGIYTALSYHGSWKEWSRFEWLWRDYPNNMIDEERANHNLNFKFTHTLSPATFYNLNFGFLGVNYKASLNGVKPSEFWLFYPDSASYADGQGVDYDTWNREY